MSYSDTLFGTVPRDWTVKTIGDIADLSQGLQISSKLRISSPLPDYMPLLKITDLPNGVYSEYVTDIKENYIATEDDIIYTRTGQVGLVYTNVYGCVHNNCFKVKVDYDEFDKMFIYYYLKSNQVYRYANQVATGSVQKDLTHSNFKACVIAYPERKKQEKIGYILSALDQKIELNNQMNKNLEKMAQAIFKQWFVDFEFPNEQGEPYISSGGKMVWCEELGKEIPEGWGVGPVTELIEVHSGGTPKTDNTDYWGGSIPFFTPKDCNSLYSLITEKTVTEIGLSKCNSKLYPVGTVFITARGTVGKLAIAGTDMAMNQSCYALKGIKGISQYQVYLQMKELIYQIQKNATGAVFDAITVSTFKTLQVCVAPERVTLLFASIVESLFEKILINSKLIEKFTKLRDTLLAKLMSGEIDVSNIEL